MGSACSQERQRANLFLHGFDVVVKVHGSSVADISWHPLDVEDDLQAMVVYPLLQRSTARLNSNAYPLHIISQQEIYQHKIQKQLRATVVGNVPQLSDCPMSLADT